MHNRYLLALVLLSGCAVDDDDTTVSNDDDAASTTTLAEGRVYDEDTDAPVRDCEVGVRRSESTLTTPEGRFSIEVARGAVLNVRCPGAIVRSFQLPEIDAINWEINVDFWGAEPVTPECIVNVTADFTGLGLASGDGSAEVVVLGSDGYSVRFARSFDPELTFLGFLTAPPGPVRVLGRAFGGSVSGFGASDAAVCPPGGGDVEIENLVGGFGTLVDRDGSWEDPNGEVEVEVYGAWQDDDAALSGAEIRLDHELDADGDTFRVSMLDGRTDPTLRVRACRTGLAGRACLHRLDIGPADPIAMGRLPQHMIVGMRLGAGRMEMFTDRAPNSGSVTSLLIDSTDAFNPTPIWRGWSPTGSIDLSTEWIGVVPPVEFLTLVPAAVENVTFDFAVDYSPATREDGWVELKPTSTAVANGD
jgi:hypothetical protein